MLLCARYVIPVSHPFIENGAVLVKDDKIADIGYAADLKARYPEEAVRDFGLAAIMPGFVNLHSHLEYSVLRGLSIDLPFAEWKFSINDKAAILSPRDWEDSALLGGLESVASGVTTIADITSTGASLRAANDIGLRAVIYRESETMEKKKVAQTIEEADADICAWRKVADPSRITVGIGGNTLYNCHPELLRAIGEYGSDGTYIALHIAGSYEETEFIASGSSLFSVHNHSLERGYGVDMPLLLLVLYVAVGEIIGCYVLGELLATVLLKRKQLFAGENSRKR